MNDSQSQAPVDSRFAPTRNPQSPAGQSLTAPSSGLQKTVDLLASPNAPQITSVGDSEFQPFSASETTTTATPVPAPTTTPPNHLLVFIGSGLVIVVCLIATWLMARKSAAGMVKQAK